MKRVLLLLAGLALVISFWPATLASAAGGDYDTLEGHFFPQTSSSTANPQGYSITNEDGIPFWDEFRRLGGVEVAGYPVSQRFLWGGFVTQAMQKVVFQWRPEVQRVYLINVFDDLHAAGRDDWLAANRSTPRSLPPSFDEGKPWAEVVKERLALLDENEAIKAAYFASPDPFNLYGLPTSHVESMGNHYAIRLQRAVIQQWTQDVPWAKAGQVTVANGGDIAKEAGLWPAEALAPVKAPPQLPAVVSAPGVSDDDLVSAQRVAARAFPAVVKLSARGVGSGTGIIFDQRGYVLTNYHVVGDAHQVQVVLVEGRRVEGRVVGADPWNDLALVKLEGDNWPSLPLEDSKTIADQQLVVAIGYSPALPDSPSVTTGLVSDVIGSAEPGSGSLLIFSSAPIFPGYSGGPLLNLKGEVVGIDTAIVATDGGTPPNQGLSIAVDSARPVIDELMADGSQRVPWIGIIPYTITPELRRLNSLPVDKGVVIVCIFSSSPASLAGLQKGDTIVKVQGQPVAKVGDLLQALSAVPVGQEVEMDVVDLAGVHRVVNVTVEERPGSRPAG